MKLAKSILCGASVLSLAVGSAFANSESHTGASMPSYEPTQAAEDNAAYYVAEPMELSYVEVYDVDEDRDGKVDGQLYLERSDSFVLMTPVEPSPGEESLEQPSGG